MTTSYVLYCTVCDTGHSSHHLWNQHLLTRSHQDKARIQISRWDESVRKCAVLLYTRQYFKVETCVEIINHFSGGRWQTIFVTDFVLSEKRPHIAILQFESKEKVNELFSEAGGPTMTIGDQMVQMKRLEKMLTLEWEELIVSFWEGSMFWDSPQEQKLSDAQMLCSNIAPKSNDDETIWSICKEFQSVLYEMEIPDEEFNLIENIISEITQVLEKPLPNLKISLYRHNFLKLRNNHKNNIYLIFMYNPKEATDCITTLPKDCYFHQLQDTCKMDQENLPNNCILRKIKYVEGDESIKKIVKKSYAWGATLVGEESGLMFTLNTRSSAIAELQLSELVRYYCEFDLRIKPLLGLLYYWAKVNSITIASDRIHAPVMHAPEPTTLEWLLLFFLHHQGKLIPPPSDILQRPHRKLTSKNDSKPVDFGFDFDVEWARTWQKNEGKLPEVPEDGTEMFVLSVLQILCKFFVFYGEVLPTPCLLNTRDGKLITLENYQEYNSHRFKEIFLSHQPEQKEAALHVTHPLGRSPWKLSVCHDKWKNVVHPAIKYTAKELGHFVCFLEQWISSKPIRKPFQRSLKTVLELGLKSC